MANKYNLFLLIATLCFPLLVSGQKGKEGQYHNFLYQSEISKQEKQNKHKKIHLFIKGDTEKIKYEVKQLNGTFKYNYGSYAAVALPVSGVKRLAGKPFVDKIYYNSGRGNLLNDSMLVNNNVLPAHQGTSPLPVKYTGDGVVVGIIDTGIDINHPDFQDSLGNTRVINIWEQDSVDSGKDTLQPYGYGQEWDSTAINAGTCTHVDPYGSGFWGHGTNVSGAAVGNGLAINKYEGVAKDADIIVVASDFNAPNWTATIADGVDYIFKKADSLGKPCVINISLGTYAGAHDGRDIPAMFIDSLIKAKEGRAVVAAAGNAGSVAPFHLGYQVTSDTNFTWFTYNGSSGLGYGAVFFELWSDTADFNNVEFSVGADQTSPSYNFRGKTPFDKINNRLYALVTDTIMNDTNIIAIVDTWAEEINGRYLLQVHLYEPDSSQYNFRFITTGSGKFDVWTSAWMGYSDIVSSGLPDSSDFPDIDDYKLPDSLQSIVSSWNCLPSVISVGNYINRNTYKNYFGDTVVLSKTPGDIHASSSYGPTRDGVLKPQITASGDVTLTTGHLDLIPDMIANNDSRVAEGGYHHQKGGTSMSAPVVAGTVALLFQACPGLDYQEIIQTITSTAKQDAFTGATLPGYQWGYGKLDAFEALKTKAFTVALNAPVTEFCDGESATIAMPSGYNSYSWNSGESSSSVTVNQPGMHYGTLTDSLGCIGYSDSATITVFANPPQPVITKTGDTLFSTTADSYQWYKDNALIPGATDSIYVAVENGIYTVEITDENGCSNISDAMEVTAVGMDELAGEEKIDLFPNPSSGLLHLELFGFRGKQEVEIYNAIGEKVYSSSLNSNVKDSMTIDLTDNATGVYLVLIKNADAVFRRKLLLNK